MCFKIKHYVMFDRKMELILTKGYDASFAADVIKQTLLVDREG